VAPKEEELQRMRYQLEDATYLGSCDWGHCNRDQAGWAICSADPSGEWLSICAECAAGNFQPSKTEYHAVDGFVTFEELLPDVS
jgi:hypothetical protein